MIIALDGPAAAGKGTLAAKLATHFRLAHLDSGALYRAVALRLRRAGGDPADVESAVRAAQGLTAEDLADPELRTQRVGQAASVVAAIPDVRRVLIDFQRRFAAHPPGDVKGAVIDGRDIGTVVCPDADAKLFVTASVEERVRRRQSELTGRGVEVSEAAVREELALRDARDRERSVAPLRRADDAHLLDTTNLSIDSAFTDAKAFIVGRLR